MPTERIEFPNGRGQTLAARLDRPHAPPRAYALFAHCFTCTADLAAATRISRTLTEHGIAVLRFDFTGLGHSEGELANTDFDGNVDDLVAAADWLRAQRRAPRILIGHSLGGAAVIAAAAQVPEARAVATIGAPSDPAHVNALFGSCLQTIRDEGQAEVTLAGRTFVIGRAFVESVEQARLEGALKDLRRALLVFHSPVDNVVGIDHAARIFQAAKHPKSFVSLDTADHLVTRAEDAAYLAGVLASWATRFIGDDTAELRPPPKANHVVVHETRNGKYQQAMAIGPHFLLADEPVGVGGDDSGPTPYDLLLASLGACTSMTMRMYADHKGFPLERAVVTLHHEKIHAHDCAACESKTGKVDRIRRTIRLVGDDLTADQRQKIIEIADKCPVHRTLHGEVVVETTVDDDR